MSVAENGFFYNQKIVIIRNIVCICESMFLCDL